jgi:hypothetical protein
MLQDILLLLINFVADTARATLFATLPARRLTARERRELQN